MGTSINRPRFVFEPPWLLEPGSPMLRGPIALGLGRNAIPTSVVRNLAKARRFLEPGVALATTEGS